MKAGSIICSQKQSEQSMATSEFTETQKKFQPAAGKATLTLFWDSEGPILEHHVSKGAGPNGRAV
jgi:hypothetical protein